MLGVVACETFYHELARAAGDAVVEYVPQWLHEFPIHQPESAQIHQSLQEKVNELESEGVDEILILYHDPEGVEGIEAASVPLHVYRGGDCIDVFLPDQARNRFESRKSAHAYYLTRGWIDVGLDCYKLFRAYSGELESLIDTFHEARERHPDLRVSWPESDRLRQAVGRRAGMRTNPTNLMQRVAEWFQRVVLVDTDNLYPVHHDYARSFRSFLIELQSNNANRSVEPLAVIEGNRDVLDSVLADPPTGPDVTTFPPGTPVTADQGSVS